MERGEVRVEGLTNPYADQIRDFFLERFPGLDANPGDSALNGIMRGMMATGQVRYGPKPNLESQVAMRAIVNRALKDGTPIPVVIPMGPKKPVNGHSVDIAELSMLHILSRLNECVRRFHPPGIDVRFRIEDFTGWHLESHVAGARSAMEIYSDDFEQLVRLVTDFATPVRESKIIGDVNAMNTAVEARTIEFEEYLRDSDPVAAIGWEDLRAWKVLEKLGWAGTIPLEMRRYYYGRFEHFYPGMKPADQRQLLAKYFALAMLRRMCGFTGADPSWDAHFQINFPGPVPGTPPELTSTRLHYRTVPMRHSKKHIPFWRARGYLKVNGEPRMALATFDEPLDLNPGQIVIRRGSDGVRVNADYMVL